MKDSFFLFYPRIGIEHFFQSFFRFGESYLHKPFGHILQ